MTDHEANESESDSIIRFECPCGKFSVETYLQDGCPKSCIPYLGMTTLSKDRRSSKLEFYTEKKIPKESLRISPICRMELVSL